MKMSVFSVPWGEEKLSTPALIRVALKTRVQHVSYLKDNLHYLKFFFTGGTQYDRDHVVVNTVNEEKLTQCWEPLVV